MAPRPSIPLHLTLAHEGRSLTLSTQVSPRTALAVFAAALAARGVQRLVSSMAVDCRDLDLLGAEEVAVATPPPQVRLGSGLDLLGAEYLPAR